MPILPMGGSLNQKVIRQAYAFTLEANRAKQVTRIENVPAGVIPFFQEMGFHAVQKETEYRLRNAGSYPTQGRSLQKQAGCL